MNKLYFYDLKTGEYQKEQEIQYDSFGNEITYFNATKIAPPTKKDGFALVFNKKEQKWEEIEDNRGKKGYVNGDAFEMKELGALPEGFTIEQPEPQYSLEEQQQMLRDERNYLLQKTDWVVLPDSPLNEEQKEAYKAYRQWLRDVPNISVFAIEPQEIQLPKTIEEFKAIIQE